MQFGLSSSPNLFGLEDQGWESGPGSSSWTGICRQTLLMCYSNAANVGGRFFGLLDFHINSCFLASLINFHHAYVTSVVIHQNHEPFQIKADIHVVELLISCCMSSRSSNAAVTSEKIFHAFQAVFLPLPPNDDVVSHPVNA